jgi:hypothetical protein
MHRDTIEFPSRKIVLITALRQGQKAVVLQLPATSQPPRYSQPLPVCGMLTQA